MAYQQPPPEQHHWDYPTEGATHDQPPPPPIHRTPVGMNSDTNFRHVQNQRQNDDPNNYTDYSTPGVIPGSDNLSERAAGGGINGIATSVANANERDSGVQAVRGMDGWGRNGAGAAGPPGHPMGVPSQSFTDHHNSDQPTQPRAMYSQRSYGSGAPLAPGAAAPAGMYSNNSSTHSIPSPPQGVPYSDSPYNRHSASNIAGMYQINPNDVADDDDWGMGPNHPPNKRRSFLPLSGSRDGSRNGSAGSSIRGGAAGVAAAAAAGGGAYAATRDGNKYNAVPNIAGSNGSHQDLVQEKGWKAEDDKKKRKKRMWIAIAIIAFIMIGAILGGVLGAFLNNGGKAKSATGQSASDVAADNKDDLGKNSAEIKKLMNNPDLHKVFPGMDYTPLNAQYPDCMQVGPSQNNITRDMAVMSQLTNSVRLYGTDCNQTQMLVHAIDRLELKGTMKLWLGVWLDKNDTTTQRQIDQTWKILDDHGCDYFKGIIVGNEVLFRKDLTSTQLLTHVADFRKNISDHNCKLPVAMADLGDNWTADMATKVDIVMSNVHPFFAGVDVKKAAGWTWNFWQEHDVALTATNKNIKQIVAEVGWPSAGGKSCGGATSCTEGSVAGIDEMNQFMQDWVCPSMKNGTEYF
ncbi:glycoside hydrolase superfamily, partial [Phaeosphaeriaceae sp. PMI808]